MSWTTESFGTLPDGRKAERYILRNDHGVTASFTNLGAIWLTMLVPDKKGNFADITLGFDSPQSYLTMPGHLGEPVGRYANRIGGAGYTLNGVRYELEKNSGPNNLHSGPDYYRDRIWETEISESGNGTTVSFSLFSPDGDQGYPGNADITVSYTLTPDDSIMIDYHLVADQDTIVNFTHHGYFNLAGHSSGAILEHQVWIDADRFTIADQYSIPTGELVPVKGTPMDFTSWKTVGQDINKDYEPLKFAGGYDHNWVLNHPAGELSLSAKAADRGSGRCMEVYTDLPGVHFYTANFLDGLAGKDGAVYQARAGFCFETQYFPDAVNKPHFPSPVLKAGQEYSTTTVFKFTLSED